MFWNLLAHIWVEWIWRARLYLRYGVLFSANFYVNRCIWLAFLGQNMQIRSIKFEICGVQMLIHFTNQLEIWRGKANLWCAIKLHLIRCIICRPEISNFTDFVALVPSRMGWNLVGDSELVVRPWAPNFMIIGACCRPLWATHCRVDHSFSYQGEIQL